MSDFKIGDEVVIVKSNTELHIGNLGTVFDYQGVVHLNGIIPIRFYDHIYFGNQYHGYHPYEIRLLTPLEKAMK